ncbi:MAG: hypothetical protein MR277_08980 [Methanobrevibacter ruminantium]|uniref:hypothetical protein n=1 Tax=Methanobrevibacter ruminantium TaxID=83816 RepID=UPI002D7FEEF5|nr:hypothetical protein [Methanobrevibacter ruminantium]MCI5738123.1 hypothetical protein [Methanobrevibacter ruminantium]
MKYVNKYLYMVFLFFIICILVSSVSALELKTDYNLTSETFESIHTDSGYSTFHLDVPSGSNFTLADKLSGEVKNDFGEGTMSFYINEGKYANQVWSIVYIEDFSDNGAIISETFTGLIVNATLVSNSEGVEIYEFDDTNDTNIKYGAFFISEDGDKGIGISGNDKDLLNDMIQNVYFDFP